MIFASKLFFRSSLLFAAGVGALGACATAQQPAPAAVAQPEIRVIAGTNAGDGEARVVVAFSNTGSAGPLSVPGSPHH